MLVVAYSGTVWYKETNGEPGLQKKGRWEGGGKYHPGDEKLGDYHACGTTHEANVNGYSLLKMDIISMTKGLDRPQQMHSYGCMERS